MKSKIGIEGKVKKGEVVNPSEYRGIYKDLGSDLEKEAKSLRGEWIRII